jgi:hypothetical protein
MPVLRDARRSIPNNEIQETTPTAPPPRRARARHGARTRLHHAGARLRAGPDFNYTNAAGVPSNAPPPIKQVIRMLVPRVDADGNEVGCVPDVLTDASLGTHLGCNITAVGARPFPQGQICNYVGGMAPFAKTRACRSGTPAGYVEAVHRAAANAVARGLLLQADADALIVAAEASEVFTEGPARAGWPARLRRPLDSVHRTLPPTVWTCPHKSRRISSKARSSGRWP